MNDVDGIVGIEGLAEGASDGQTVGLKEGAYEGIVVGKSNGVVVEVVG